MPKRNGSYKKSLAFRPIRRPKNRWEDDVRKDLQTSRLRTGRRVY
jgi:hypothetical protein